MKLENWINTQIGQDIWKHKYQFKDETFDQWLDRVSNGNEDLKQLIINKQFLFGGRILANRGLNKKGLKVTYSNCYVIPKVEDNLESIFDTAKNLARTYSYGGGCGVDISNLRPCDMKVHNAADASTGSISFMDLYSKVTEVISARGRRGALMISIICTHPDLLKFIDIKNDLDKVTKANISIRILDEFMKAVDKDKNWTLSFINKEYNDKVEQTYRAREIYHKICENNWNMAEPGMLFWDSICNWNLLSEDEEFEYAGTNPCAEEPLPAGGSCLLGSINLSQFVENPFTEKAIFNGDKFKKAIQISIKALNDVLLEGLMLHPLEIQRQSVNQWRQTGLGVMGIADMLLKLNIQYGSEDSLKFCDKLGFVMANESIKTSSLIAKEQGVYPKYKKQAILNSPYFIKNTTLKTRELVYKYGLAHSQLMTIAPTGSLSTMLGISGGIEPIYNISYTRKTESLHDKDVYYKVYTPIAEKYMKLKNVDKEENLPATFVTAMTLNYKDRINMQSIWQEHIDASISSTVNVPNNFSVNDVEQLYMYAWKKKLKGVTIYRDGCKRSGILTNNTEKKKDIDDNNNTKSNNLPRGYVIDVDDSLIGHKRKLQTGCGSLHVEAFFSPDTGDMMEVYLSKGSSGGYNSFMVGLSRMISTALRGGVTIESIVDQLGSVIPCPSYAIRSTTKKDTSKGKCCPDAIGNALLEMQNEMYDDVGYEEITSNPIKINNKKVVKKENTTDTLSNEESKFLINNGEIAFAQKYNKCPSCGEELRQEGGCISCINCSWSKCD
ncbi:MAG: adenosylcobalamin-dependent ribonucleoside-diphosphate reductase [Bacillota bacterium]|nr:adenosylcobalamin-dependent ribonucleoside-diphosphate reductase [Bacillota bacterium]